MIRIGIDCGVNTGYARINASGGLIRVASGCIISIMEKVLVHYRQGAVIKLYIEDARQRKWIPTERNAKQVVGRAKGAGSVCRDAQIWQEFCEYYGIDYELVAPKNNKTKLNAEQFKRLTGWQAKTNEHGRDAAMLIWQRG
jgi:hypothetical protein